MIRNRSLLILLILGLLLRLVLSVQFYSGDVNNHISWGKDILVNGVRGIYDREFYFRYGTLTPNYPPLVLFLFTASYGLYEFLYNASLWLHYNVGILPGRFVLLFQNINLLPAFLKLPAILADIGIAWVVYLFAKKILKGKMWPLVASSLILFNPAFFYNSASWGQVEALPIFFFLLSFYLLLYSKKFYLAAIFIVLALLSKQTVAVLIPLFALVFYQRAGLIKTLKSSLLSVFIFWFSFLSFYKQGEIFTFPFIAYWQKILTNSVSDYVTYHAFNWWVLFVGFNRVHDSGIFVLNFSYQLVGYLIFAIFFLMALYVVRKSIEDYKVIWAASLISFASFLFLTRLHERHLEQTIPFLLLVSLKDKRIMPIFVYVSLFSFMNLYQDWWAPRIPVIVNILSEVNIIKLLVGGLLLSFVLLFSLPLKLKKT